MKTKELNIKNRIFYFYNDLINTRDFDVRLLKVDKKTINGTWYLLHWLCHKKT